MSYANNPGYGIYNTPFSSQPSAVLWIFSPRAYSHQARRPFIYNFDANFVNAAEDAVAQASHNGRNTKLTTMVQNPYLMNAMRPSMMPDHMIHMGVMSNNWTFLLITMNDKNGPGGMMRQMSDVQHLYCGYFVDEPVNPLHHMGQLTPNPAAQLVVTHKSQINQNNPAGAYGQVARLDLIADIDVVRPDIQAQISSIGNTVIMRPEDLCNNIASDGRGGIVTMFNPGSQLNALEGPVMIDSKLCVPRYNLQKVLSAVSDTQQAMLNQTFESRQLSDFDRDTFDGLLQQNLVDTARMSEHGLPLNMVITLGRIHQQYNPKIEVLNQDHQPRYDPIDQSTGSMRNVFASLLSSIVPAIMTTFMLADITFYYNSSVNDFKIDEHAPLSAMTVLPHNDLHRRVEAFLFRLRSEIMPIIRSNHGEFDLSMHATCAGVSQITLNFFDDAISSAEVFEVPVILGGFNNALVGGPDVFDTNTRELSNLITAISANDSDTPPQLSLYDTPHFEQSLLSYDRGAQPFVPGTSSSSDKWRI